MHFVVGILGIVLVIGTFRDLISTVITTQRDRRWSAARRFFRISWRWYSNAARKIDDPARRERFLVPYGPMSLVGLLAVWVALLMFGWGLIWWGLQQHMEGINDLSSAVYGSLLVTTLLAVQARSDASTEFVALTLVIGVGVFWLTEVWSELVNHRVRGPISRAQALQIARDESPMLSAAVVPALILAGENLGFGTAD